MRDHSKPKISGGKKIQNEKEKKKGPLYPI
jgi:hypothetical protein